MAKKDKNSLLNVHYSRTMTSDNLSKAANYVGNYVLKGLGAFGKIMTAPFVQQGPTSATIYKSKELLAKERTIENKSEELLGKAMTWVSPLNYGAAVWNGHGLNARKGEEEVASWSPAWQAIGRLGELYIGPKVVKGVKSAPKVVVNTAAKAGVKPAKAAVVAREIKLATKNKPKYTRVPSKNLFRTQVYKGGEITDPYSNFVTTDPLYAANYGKVTPYIFESRSVAKAKEPMMGSSDPVTMDMFIYNNTRRNPNATAIIGHDAATGEFTPSKGIEILNMDPKNLYPIRTSYSPISKASSTIQISPEELYKVLKDQELKGYYFMGHGTGRTNVNPLVIFDNGLRIKKGDIGNTTSPISESNLTSWPHMNSEEIIILPGKATMTKYDSAHGHIPSDWYSSDVFHWTDNPKKVGSGPFAVFEPNASFTEQTIGGVPGVYTKPEAILGSYNTRTHTLKLNPKSLYAFLFNVPKLTEPLTSLKFFERGPAKISEAERVGVPKGERNVKQGYLLKDAIEEANKFAEKWGYDKLSQNATLLDIENLYNQHNTFFRGVTTEQLENTRNRVAKELGINPELLTNDLYLLYVSTHPWPGNDRIWVTPFSHYGKIYGNSDMIGGKGLVSAVMRPWKTTKDIKQWPKLSLWTLGFKEDVSNPVITPWVSNAPDAIRSLGALSEFLVKSPLIYRGLGKDFKGTFLLYLKYKDDQGKLGWIESLVGELPLEIIIEKQGGKMNILEFLKNGSKIHIKEKNKGKFTSYCGGKVTDECILKGKNSSNPAIRKRATFAANARKWKHQFGGIIPGTNNSLDYKQQGVLALNYLLSHNPTAATMSQWIKGTLSYLTGIKDSDLIESKYTPSKASSKNAKYYTRKGLDYDVMRNLLGGKESSAKTFEGEPLYYKNFNDLYTRLSNLNGKQLRTTDNSHLGEYTIGIGEDSNGRYVSYYDKFDWAPKESLEIFSPYEIYNRIYEKDFNRMLKELNNETYSGSNPSGNWFFKSGINNKGYFKSGGILKAQLGLGLTLFNNPENPNAVGGDIVSSYIRNQLMIPYLLALKEDYEKWKLQMKLQANTLKSSLFDNLLNTGLSIGTDYLKSKLGIGTEKADS